VSVATVGATPYLPAGTVTRLITTVTNDSPRRVGAVAVRPGAPRGWHVTPARGRIGSLAAGASATVAWDVVPRPGAGWTTLRPTAGAGSSVATFDVPPAPPTGFADLTRHRWAYGSMTPTADLSSRPRMNRSANGTHLKINGRSYARGVGVNAWSDLRYWLGGRCSRFTADVGLDDSVPSGDVLKGSARVSVLADGRRLFSRFMDWSMPPAHLDLPVTGVDELRLQVDATRDWIWDDVTDWGSPRLTCTG
jgi:hypothetical protein